MIGQAEGSTCSVIGRGLWPYCCENASFASARIPMSCRPTGAPVGPKGRAGQGEGIILKCFQELCSAVSAFQLRSAAQNYKDTDETMDLLPFSREDLAWSVAAWIRKCVLDSME